MISALITSYGSARTNNTCQAGAYHITGPVLHILLSLPSFPVCYLLSISINRIVSRQKIKLQILSNFKPFKSFVKPKMLSISWYQLLKYEDLLLLLVLCDSKLNILGFWTRNNSETVRTRDGYFSLFSDM